MKQTSFFLVFMLLAATALCQPESPVYKNVMERFVQFYNDQQNDSLYQMFSPIVQQKSPPDKTKEMTANLHKQLGNIKSYEYVKIDRKAAVYKTFFDNATLATYIALDVNKKINGLFFKPFMPDNIIDSTDTAASKINVTATVADGKLNGVLTVPQTTRKVPVILLIAGSGPTDRNGNNILGVSGNTYLMLAKELLHDSIACLRYDKRGVATSNGRFKEDNQITFEDMVTDADAFYKILKADPRFSKIYILGHSEGSLIGMVLAAREKADGFISVSGAGRPLDQVIAQQLQEQHPDLENDAVKIMDSLKKGYAVYNVPEGLEPLFNPRVQNYMISILRYDPAAEIKKLSIPVMIIQGTTDLQVSVKDAELLKAAKPDATLKIIDGMNHVLKAAPADPEKNKETYSEPQLPLKAELVTDIKDFIKENQPKAKKQVPKKHTVKGKVHAATKK